MDRRVAAVAFALVALAAAAEPSIGADPGPAQTRAITLVVTASACANAPEGVCLLYNGAAPGPAIDANLGDTIVVTLENRIAETIAGATNDGDLIARLGAASVSWHVHGTALAADSDGILAHEGTELVESVAPPGGSFTYRSRLAFPGTWHYHDHVLGPDGSEGVARGLYGSLLVRPGFEARPDHVFDLHMLDEGANGGRGMNATVRAGDSFEVAVVGLGDMIWNVRLVRGTSPVALASVEVGPGMSDRLRLEDAEVGQYRLRTVGGFEGTIEVIA